MLSPSSVFPFPFSSSTHSFHDDGESLLSFKNLITSESLFLCYFSSSFSLFPPPLTMDNPSSPSRSSSPAILIIPWPLGIPLSPFATGMPFPAAAVILPESSHHLSSRQLVLSPLTRSFSKRTPRSHTTSTGTPLPPENDNQFEANIPHQLASCRNLVSQHLYLGANILTEYGFGEIVSAKGDVYSYGILLLEMFTGKRPTSDMFVGNLNLHKWVNMAFPNKVNEVIHNNIFTELDSNEFEKYIVQECLLSLLRVGLLCSKDSPNERPTMREVVAVLENLKKDLVANTIASKRLRRSISDLLGNTNAPRKDVHASNDQSSSTF